MRVISLIAHLLVLLTVPPCTQQHTRPTAREITLVPLPPTEDRREEPALVADAPESSTSTSDANETSPWPGDVIAPEDLDDLSTDEVSEDALESEDALASPTVTQAQESVERELSPTPPAPTPTPTPKPRPSRWQRFVHTDPSAASQVSDNEGYISNHSTRAEQQQRQRVTTPLDGPTLSDASESEAAAVSPGLADPDRPPEDARGDTVGALETQREAPREPVAASDESAKLPAAGAPTPAATSGSSRGSDPQPVASSLSRGAREGRRGSSEYAASGYDFAPNGLRELGADRRDGWQPTATRILVAPRVASPTPATAPRPVSVPMPQDESPHPRPEATTKPLPPSDETVTATVTLEEASLEPVTQAPDTSPDIVADLRASLGWGQQDHDRTSPRHANLGAIGSIEDVRRSSLTVLPDDQAELGDVQVTALDTPLGHYMAQVDGLIRERWFQLELDPVQKALGVQGRAVIEMLILRSGKIIDIQLTVSSGSPYLDAMALSAVPERVPKVPRDLTMARNGIAHRITLTYRNLEETSTSGAASGE